MERMMMRLMRKRSLLQQQAGAAASLFSTQQQHAAADPGVLPGIKIRDSASQLIGRTPMVYLNRVTEGCGAHIAAKLEFLQPSFSVKDRPAISMLEDAEKKGLVTPAKVSVLLNMAACVDKWHPTHPGRLSSSINRYSPDCTTDRPSSTEAAAASRSGGGCCVSDDDVWDDLRAEAQADAESEPLLRKFYGDLVLSRPSLESALAAHLAAKLCVPGALPQDALRDLLSGALTAHPEAGRAARADLLAARDRDPACDKMVHCFLYYKGFLALQAHRATHGLWAEGRAAAALLLQSRASEVFGVDIHPGARIGCGVLFDHATGVVIGQTAVVGDNVSILHGVTLGGTGKVSGDRHPKVGDGVLIGSGASVLGNVRIGAGAKIGAGAVVLCDVPEGTTFVGNPAKAIGKKAALRRPEEQPGVTMEQRWSDYVV